MYFSRGLLAAYYGPDWPVITALPAGENGHMQLAKVLGVAPSSAYELMHEKDFPTLKVGNRLVIPKEDFIAWVRSHTGGAK